MQGFWTIREKWYAWYETIPEAELFRQGTAVKGERYGKGIFSEWVSW
ncbi:hypothetical protein [Planomicrobium sp. CPCC 101079]|nr:hypothetical protein [Planomicrobium sp. CPCC 101079]